MNVTYLQKACNVEGHKITYNRLTNKIYFDGSVSFPLKSWMDRLNQALIRAHCTTVPRVALFLAECGAESGSFRWTEELASGAEYNNRSDLGNIYPGDGERFKGGTYIQITGRHNYGALSTWAHAHGYVPTPTFFVDHPAELRQNVKYIFLGPVWYWIVARNMNYYADRMDINGGSTAVQGSNPANNLYGRTLRWNKALSLGDHILPRKQATTKHVIHNPAPKPVVPAKHAKPAPKPAPKPVSRPPTHQYATVHSGDNLTAIANRYHVKGGWLTLQRINNLRNPNMIYVGQRLRVR